MSNEVDEPKIMLVGKGSRKSLFSFVPLSKWLQEASNQDTVSRHKDGLLQALPWVESGEHEEKDCLFNPCTGYRMIYWNRHKELLQLQLHPMWKAPISCCEQEGNPFAIDNKNVGLAFSQVIQDHVVVAIFYDWRDYKTRGYYLRCVMFGCGFGYSMHLPGPPLPVNDMPPASLDGFLYWMSD
ncbi:Os05g0520000 [Oryza sativa Japonica Group]|uniref:Uncharacterized protein n=2 Tax=Oryza sativa subsp. japonica TaxID=39947 RepID=A0A8J8Y627_ORYSJ|nr:hypothetical protein OsJ_19235 [Oryza sativa Japonica Group]BAS94930.1 Os05g0520000 [Oryza sativa Japonica Group]